MDRCILHCDCNSYFASVEILLNPALRDLPVAVAGDPESRHGIVVARNELAKQFGVKTTDPVYLARRKCPDLVLVRPHHDKYVEISGQINQIYLNYTDLVDPYSIDESFIDITGTQLLRKTSPKYVADEIRERVKREIGITISVGVSFNRCFAKLAGEMKKPDGTTLVPREKVGEMIHTRPVSELLYVGHSTSEVLRKLGIRTIGDLAAAEREVIDRKLGKHGEMVWKYANGLDDEPVRSYYEPREVKSVSSGLTFRRDLCSDEEIRTGVAVLADSVAARLRSHALKCRTVQVQIRDGAFRTISRQKTLTQPTHLMREIADSATELVLSNWVSRTPIRMLTISCADLISADEDAAQMSLFVRENDAVREKRERLEAAVARIRGKHGAESISYGYMENDEIGIGKDR